MIDSKARMPVMRHDVRGARQRQRRAAWLRRSPSSLAQGGSPMALTLNPEWGDML